MSSIPEEIIENIILRLPVKSILRFKSMCKGWYALIHSPKFIEDHLILNSKNPRIMTKDIKISENRVKRGKRGIYYYSFGYSSILASPALCRCEETVLMDNPVIIDNGVKYRFHDILGSCNGLLCLGAIGSRTVILWNPSTHEYKEIRKPIECRMLPSYGFGYDSKINDYKLLLCIKQHDDEEVYVYTLKSGSWRKVVVETIPCLYFTDKASLLMNGALHWIGVTATNETSKAIVTFDISSEKFMNLPFPETIIVRLNDRVYLIALGDSLCLVCDFQIRVDVWVMQNYGVRESWIKKFTTAQEIITSYPDQLKLYWSFQNGKILIQVRNDFVLYDEKNDKFEFVYFMGIHNGFDFLESESYVQSLVSLNSGTYTGINRRRIQWV